jgi:hypothetical protein
MTAVGELAAFVAMPAVIGFVSGYAVRSYVSYLRRSRRPARQ